MKNLMKCKLPFTIIASLLVIIYISFTFQGCSKDEATGSDNASYIDIPVSSELWIENNDYRNKYIEAKKRFNNYIYVENNQFNCKINNGATINISETLFTDLLNGYSKLNQIIKSKNLVIIPLESHDFIIAKRNTGKLGLIRLKSGELEGSTVSYTPVSLSGNDQSIGNSMVSGFKEYAQNFYNVDNMTQLFNMNSGGFSVTSPSKSGTCTVNGKSIDFSICDGCKAFNNNANSNCTGNNICEYRMVEAGNGVTYFQIVGCDGLPLATLKADNAAEAAAVRSAIGW